MTELSGVISIPLKFNAMKKESLGTVAQNVQIKVVDPETGKSLGPNQIGEFWFKSDALMERYFRNPEATKNAIDKDGTFFQFCHYPTLLTS